MRQGYCKHFNGIQHDKCGAGLNMRDVTGGDPFGWAKRMPCIASNACNIECKSYSEPTEQELKDYNDFVEKRIAEIEVVSPLLKLMKKRNPRGGSGTTDCPICKNNLHYSISPSNNHIHAKCETDGCIYIME